MKNTLLFIALIFSSVLSGVNSTSAQQTFHKSYGDVSTSTTPRGIINTADGGYLLFGDYYEQSLGHAALFIKTDVAGDTLWTLLADNSISTLQTNLTSGVELANGQGYMFTGYYMNPSAPLDPSGSLMIRLDAAGGLVWVKIYDYAPANIFWFKNSCLAADGNLLVLGIAGSMFTPFSNILLKVNTGGFILWSKNISGFEMQDETTQHIVELPDQSIVFLCDSLIPSTSSINASIIKLDSVGDFQWAKSYSLGNEVWMGLSLSLTANNNLLVTGQHINANQLSTGFIMSLDGSGNVDWAREYGIPSADNISVRRAHELGNGNVAAITGVADTIILFETDASGTVQWSKGFHPAFGTTHFQATDFEIAGDGGFAIVGSDFQRGQFVKTDGSGVTDCDMVPVSISSNAQTITATSNTSAVSTITISILSPAFSQSRGTIISDPCATSGMADVHTQIEVNFFPVPFSEALHITVENPEEMEIILYDLASRKLLQQKFTNHVSLNTGPLAKGIYLYEVKSGDGFLQKGKVIKN